MNSQRRWIIIFLASLMTSLFQLSGVLSLSPALAGVINSDGLVINYDHSSFTSGSSVVTNLVSGKPDATLRSNTSTSTPTIPGSSSRNYFTTTANVSSSDVFSYNNNFLYTNTGMTSSTFGDATKISAFAWVYPTAANHVVLEERGSDYNSQSWYDTQIEMVNQTYNFRLWGCSIFPASSTTTLNAWHYVGFTYDGSNLYGYVDGSQVANGSCTRSVPFPTYSVYYGVGTNAGTDMNSSGRFYGGFRLGALHIYNRALTSAQVNSNALVKTSQSITLTSLGTSSKTYPYSQSLNMSVSGTSGSGLVTFAITGGTATGCILSNSTSTATLTSSSSGTCAISATIASDTFFDAATSSSLEFTFSKASQILTFSTTAYSKYYGETQTVTATSAGTGTVSYSVGSSTACSVSGSTVSITSGTGTCSISASRLADENYLSATSTNSVNITVSKAPQSALTLSSGTGTYLSLLRLTSSGGSDTGTVTFAVSSAGSAGCSISNSDSLTSTSAGTCQVVATKAATPNYFSAYDTQTITIGKAALTLTASISGSSTVKYASSAATSYTTNRSLGTGNIANLTGTISYSAVNSTACSVNSSTGAVQMTAASGACSVRVSLASDSNYSDTSSATVSLTPAKADTLTVTASAVTMTYTGSSQTIPYSYSISGLKFSDTITAISYSYSGTPNSGGGATGSANVDQAGTYTITPASASITNSDSYTAIIYATGTLTVDRASRTVTGSASASAKYGSTTTVTATTSPSSSSDGTFSYSAGASNACSVVSGTGIATMLRASGTCSITPSISQGNNYLAATGTAVSITPATADALAVTAGNATATYSGSTVSVAPSYSISGLKNSDTVTVTYKYSGTDNANNGYALSSTAPTNAGTYSIVPVVTMSNSDSYTAPSTLTNGVLTVNRASRTVSPTTYNTNSLKYGGTATVSSNSTSPSTNSDGTFSYSVGSGCSVNSSTGVVTATSASGTCSETTTIGRGANYETATAASVTFTLSKADTITVTASTPSTVTYTGSPAISNPTVSVSGLVNGDAATGATFNYSRSSTCATGGVCSVGDTGPGGGIVFYVSATAINAADGISTGGLYLEAAPSSLSKPIIQWCTGGSNPFQTLIGGTSNSIGYGALNTKIMLANCSGGAGYSAADLTLNSKSDWFLPSYDEQTEMYLQKTLLNLDAGTPAASNTYWGSSETANWHASSIVPAGGIGVQSKIDSISYWPIRAFSPSATAYSSSSTAPTNAGIYDITPSALTLSGGSTTDNYIATIYTNSSLTINKANQSIFSDYSSLEAVLGSAFQIYPFGGSGDGAVYLSVTNGTATGCSASMSSLTALTAGTCSLTITKSANENYNQAQSSFTITFYYFVPAPSAPVSTRPTEIAIDAPVAWSATATAAPSITSFTPSSGGVGTVVTITGVGFDGVNSVKIGRKALTSFTGVSSTQVTAVIPSGATSGPLVVTNSFGSDFSSQSFTFTP